MSGPLISIVVIFDQIREQKLRRLLESMKGQLSDHNTEVLFVHESNVSRTCPTFPVNVKYHTIPEKRGIAFNRNRGIEFAKGKIVVFIDDDCWVQDQWLDALVQPLLQDTKIYAVTSGTRIPHSNFVGDCVSA